MFITQCLAELPPPGSYINLYKLGVVLALFGGWAYVCQWVDRDTDYVKTKRERWNLIVMGTGMAGMAILFLIPWSGTTYFMGLAFWLLLAGGGQMSYVIHRNGRVTPDRRVLTIGHAKSLMSRDDSSKVSKLDRGQRIHLSDHEGNNIGRPLDRDESEKHDAAQEFLFDVLWRRASDVDVLVGQEKVRAVYRIDGVDAERKDVLGVDDAERVLLYCKRLAGLNPDEIRRPQQGSIFVSLLGDAGDLGRIDIVTSGSTMGERLRLKVHQSAGRKPLDELGMAKGRIESLRKLIDAPKGMLLLSGLKGSGVTTTQYAILRSHDAFMRNIHLLQRHPLYELDNITQIKHEKTEKGVSYARQLQSVLRREPDVVGIGECVDRETAQIALRAAAADRKIYMVIEGKSTFDALARLISFTEDPKLVGSALVGVINQKLIRVLCSSCRQSFKPDESLLRKVNIPPDKVEHFHRPPTEPVYDRKGREIICQTCQGSGYVGRAGVFEVLVVDSAISKLIVAGAPTKQIRDRARKNRMYYMQEEGLRKVIDGTTSLDEIIRGLRVDGK